jgi:tRNA G26 N,N-dimethylase Trm1
MILDPVTLCSECEAAAYRNYKDQPSVDRISYEVGLLRSVVGFLCREINEYQIAIENLHKGQDND